MAIADSYGLFWNSSSGDRKYNAESFEKWLRKFFTSGVFEGDLQVLASSGMTVTVQTGYANLYGKVGLFETVTNLTLNAANSTYPRIDTIVIERNDADRIIELKIVQGAYSGNNPQPTAPVWDTANGIYQLVIAQIAVAAGASAITQADITDTREDSNLCGYITGTVEEIDFSQITAQFEAYYAEFVEGNEADFDAWFEHMKDQLSEDAAGHLQEEIDTINQALTNKQPKILDNPITIAGTQQTTVEGALGGLNNNKSNKSDLASISVSGTNTTGSTIKKGTYFYNNGSLVVASADIASNATITIGTNVTTVTKGALNEFIKKTSETSVTFHYYGLSGAFKSGWGYTLICPVPAEYQREGYNSCTLSNTSNMYGYSAVETYGNNIPYLIRLAGTASDSACECDITLTYTN